MSSVRKTDYAAWTWVSMLGCVVQDFVALLCCWVGWLSFVSVVSWIWFALAGCNHTVL